MSYVFTDQFRVGLPFQEVLAHFADRAGAATTTEEYGQLIGRIAERVEREYPRVSFKVSVDTNDARSAYVVDPAVDGKPVSPISRFGGNVRDSSLSRLKVIQTGEHEFATVAKQGGVSTTYVLSGDGNGTTISASMAFPAKSHLLRVNVVGRSAKLPILGGVVDRGLKELHKRAMRTEILGGVEFERMVTQKLRSVGNALQNPTLDAPGLS